MAVERKDDIIKKLRELGIECLYHITDKDNIPSILKERGLFSWQKSVDDGIIVSRPGGNVVSHRLEAKHPRQLNRYVHLFASEPPADYLERLSYSGVFSELCVLKVSLDAIRPERYVMGIGDPFDGGYLCDSIQDLEERLHENPSLKDNLWVDLLDSVHTHYLSNVPEDISRRVSEVHPTAIVFVVDQSRSMARGTDIDDVSYDYISELAAISINEQIERLLKQCITKDGLVNHLFDIAVIGYGDSVSPAWNGELSNSYFHTPLELLSHNSSENHLRWVDPKDNDKRGKCHEAFGKVYELLAEWSTRPENRYSYPPTVIHISDGDVKREYQREFLLNAQRLKDLNTEIGNVIVWNIGLLPGKYSELVFLSGEELPALMYFPGGLVLYEASSYLPKGFQSSAASIHHGDVSLERKTMGINVRKQTLSAMLQMCILPNETVSEDGKPQRVSGN